MSNFTHEIKNQIAWVSFDSGGMNTLSQSAITDLTPLLDEIDTAHASSPLKAVILKGNKYGLGAGANIGELMQGTKEDLERLIDEGHETLFRIEENEVPWLAVIDGIALGGIYELALACEGIIATEKSTVGFPEIRLNIFPGLGGTQRAPRRCGLINAEDPMTGDAGFTAILTGKNFRAKDAASIKLIDAVVPAGEDIDAFAEKYALGELQTLEHPTPADLANAEALKPMVLPMIQKATMGRQNPRAPYVALDVIAKGAGLPLREAMKVERDAFIEVAASAEGKAGMRFFFTQQQVTKAPKGFPAPRTLKKIGIDGADGYMGNAITWLALQAGYEVVAHAPLEKFAPAIPERLLAKYGRAIKAGKMSEDDAKKKVASVKVTSAVADLADCDLVIEARMENREIKADFYRALGGVLNQDALVASNSSSMGPGILAPYFHEGGGSAANFVNLHFFSPAEHPMMQLVEVIRGASTSDEAVATAHAFTRKINKTPVILHDGSPGFLVNAGLAAYFGAAEELFLEGTPIDAIDKAIRASVLPMGPFELGDQAGLDIAAGMFDTIAAEQPPTREPLVWKMREQERFGIKSGGGYYEYEGSSKKGVWAGLDGLAGGRGSREASAEEIVERCMKALYATARKLVDGKIVGSEEECDLSFVFGIGFAMYLGGPIFYGQQQGWE